MSHSADRADLAYFDFELEISPVAGREYTVSVIRSPAGEARETMRFPFDELALESRLDKLEIALLRSGGKRRQILSPEEQVVRNFGQDLFNAIFTGEVRSRYDVSVERARQKGRGTRLKLRIQPPELAALPWELLYDPREKEYVCLSRSTPVVRYLQLPRPIPPLRITPPLRLLGMIATPQGPCPLDVDREMQRVERGIQHLRERGDVELTWLGGQTWRDLQRAMRRGPWHVFHFIGHGGFDRDADEGFILLADAEGAARRLSATQLGRLLADHTSLRLVLLNACEGARGSERDVFSSSAAILVRRGIPAVLAMQYAITDWAAIELARAFYEALADGLPVDAAVTEARKAISLAIPNTVEWGTPVLFMRSPDGLLFRTEAGKTKTLPLLPAQPETSLADEPQQPVPHLEERVEPTTDGVYELVAARQPFEPEMIHVPAGEFLMGSDPHQDHLAFDEEYPQHSVYLPEFFLARTPVTNAQYAAFVGDTDHDPPVHWEGGKPLRGKEDHPVVRVSWYDALAYCEWLSRVTGKPYCLPSEAEWEKAARGGDGRTYPWGETCDTRRCNLKEAGRGGTTPVEAFPEGASPYGLLDMAGNVWEWTRTLWGTSFHTSDYAYPYQAGDGRENLGADNSTYRIVRGGAFYTPARGVRCASRYWSSPYSLFRSRGFRVVISPLA